MLLAAAESLAMLAFLGGLIAAAFNYLGGSTLHLVLQLLWQGAQISVIAISISSFYLLGPQSCDVRAPQGQSRSGASAGSPQFQRNPQLSSSQSALVAILCSNQTE